VAQQYSPKTVLRQAPNGLLAGYFKKRGIDLNVDWKTRSLKDTDRVFAAMQQLPAAVYKDIESDFSMVGELASGAGTRAILEVGLAAGHADWPESFRGAANACQIALWTFLHDPDIFFQAGNFHEMDRFRSWTRWYVGGNIEPALDRDGLLSLSQQLSVAYAKQGRGRFCHVDAYVREDPRRYCFFAFPEDHTRTDMGYSDAGRFIQHRPWRSALEIIFAYRPQEGVLELHAHGRKAFKDELADAFCRAALDLPNLPAENGKARYNLSVFKDRQFRFVTNPADRVAVHIRQLDFCFRRDPSKRVVLSAAPTRWDPEPVYQLLERVTAPSALALEKLDITRVKLRLVFATDDRKRGKTLTFEVAHPDRCTLRDDPYDRVARQYLKQWGVDCA